MEAGLDREEQKAIQLKASLPMLQKDRRDYPGWLVAPQRIRITMEYQWLAFLPKLFPLTDLKRI